MRTATGNRFERITQDQIDELTKARMIYSFRRVFRSVAKFLLRTRAPFSVVRDILRETYIEAALQDGLPGWNESASASGWAVRLGVPEEEIKRYVAEPETSRVPASTNWALMEAVLTRWRTDRTFLGPYGMPQQLALFEPGGRSFIDLVASLDSTADPLVIMEELIQMGWVQRVGPEYLMMMQTDRIGANIRPVYMIERVGVLLERQARTFDVNLDLPPADRLLQRKVFSDFPLSVSKIPVFTQIVKALVGDAMFEIDDWLLDACKSVTPGEEVINVGCVVTQYTEGLSDDAPREDLLRRDSSLTKRHWYMPRSTEEDPADPRSQEVSDEFLRDHERYAIRRTFRPLVKILLHAGVEYYELRDVLKYEYVNAVLRDDLWISQSKLSLEEVGQITGVAPAEVVNLLTNSQLLQAPPPSYDELHAAILTKWNATDEFSDSYGMPLILNFAEPLGRCFTDLVLSIRPDVDPGEVRDQMLARGYIQSIGSRQVKIASQMVLHHGVAHGANFQQLAGAMEAIVSTLFHNLTSESSDRLVQREVMSDVGLPVSKLAEFRALVSSVLGETAVEINKSLVDLMARSGTEVGEMTRNVGVTMFQFEERPSAAAAPWLLLPVGAPLGRRPLDS